MTPEEFRKAGHEVVDWIADYLRDVREYPVTPTVAPGDLIDRLPTQAPEQGEPIDAILKDFRELIVPGLTLWNHPRFLAYFSISASGPGILGEMLAAGLLDETRRIRETFPGARPLESVGYFEACAHLDGRKPEGRELRAGIDGLFDEISLSTRQLRSEEHTSELQSLRHLRMPSSA